MSTHDDEPLDGDIGPAAPATAPPPSTPVPDRAAELRRYEEEREARRRRTDRIAGRIALWAAVLLLAFLAYDSASTAVEAHRRGDDWLYPPAANAALFTLAALALTAWSRSRHRHRRRTR
ncbi:hypothetical protein [Actinomadura parmotrematis]|uniref:Uncharacterized protein n=1 Tax=Actinomadura parmotrematis TaxID=2864039 RepID=A0ABS7G021_9ACTN|nr:hypothetical protein [Actinomadura parmotrematis]MBW8485740.1 hypothetical protein [Actinomadura parmotrematis]